MEYCQEITKLLEQARSNYIHLLQFKKIDFPKDEVIESLYKIDLPSAINEVIKILNQSKKNPAYHNINNVDEAILFFSKVELSTFINAIKHEKKEYMNLNTYKISTISIEQFLENATIPIKAKVDILSDSLYLNDILYRK